VGAGAVLNLGAGRRIVAGAINTDLVQHSPDISIIHDLNIVPWPWRDGEFDEVQAISVLEHLKLTLIESLDECWRILKPGGRLVVKYPLAGGPTAYADPTHRWQWGEGVTDYVDPRTLPGQVYDYYTPHKWEILSRGIIKDRNVKVIMRPMK
jgi:predicted SAM-dependent methyltransferase